jgi:hypothetical protein
MVVARMKTRVVTGYVRVENSLRPPAEYQKLGQKLSDAISDWPLACYYEYVPDLWLTKFIESLPPMEPPLTWSKGDNEVKNTLEYHCINHQKFKWLERACNEDQESDTFIWVDYGIMHQPGLNAENVRSFLRRIRKDDFAFPGCWPATREPISDDYPSWRFLGSLMIVPREHMRRLVECTYAMTRLHVRLMKKVTFEVNTMVRVEPYLNGTGFRWYEADHNASMLENYR